MASSVDHMKYYNVYPMETIDIMIKVFGKDKVSDYCLINAFKYRMRVGHKNSVDEDLLKEQWYLNMYRELKGRDE